MTDDPAGRYRVTKPEVRAAFERAAAHYDERALLQREVGRRLLERLNYMRLEPSCVLDLGCGTGRSSAALRARYPAARVVSLDLSPAMLHRARERAAAAERQGYLCADIEHLPLAERSADLVFSNLALQWCNDLARALGEILRVLRPGGMVMFATFGPDTLKELRASWRGIDRFNHVNAFTDMHDIGDALLRSGFADPVMDREDFTLTYPDVRTLMADLKALGAHNSTAGRPRGLTGKGRLARVISAYERHRREGLLPATYEVLYGHGWAPHAKRLSGTTRRGAAVAVPLSELGRRRP